MICHVARHDLVVLGHSLDHQALDELAHAQLELIERIGHRCPNDPFALTSLFLDLLEEEPVFFAELRAEALVEHLDDLG